MMVSKDLSEDTKRKKRKDLNRKWTSATFSFIIYCISPTMLERFQSLHPLQELDLPSTVNQTMKERARERKEVQREGEGGARGISACSRITHPKRRWFYLLAHIFQSLSGAAG